GDEVVPGVRGGGCGGVQVNAVAVAAVLLPALAAGGVHEDAAHGLGGGGEEVPAALPAVLVGGADQAEVGFVDQGGGLEGVAGRLGGHPGGGEFAQLIVDEREQVGGGTAVPGRGRVEQSADVGHGGNCTAGAARSETLRRGELA